VLAASNMSCHGNTIISSFLQNQINSKNKCFLLLNCYVARVNINVHARGALGLAREMFPAKPAIIIKDGVGILREIFLSYVFDNQGRSVRGGGC
jgi:hypothetical protein